jgi:polysaccharide biosynthesis/export protein VpsN
MRMNPLVLLPLLLAVLLGGCEGLFGPPAMTALPAAPVAPQAVPEYRLGTGDVISVRVYGGDEDTRIERLRLSDTGQVVLPFGDFTAKGKTARELESAITQNVRGRLLVNPRVSVTIDEYRPFFVDGQVGRPGAYPYQPGLTVRKAITIAGGLRERASVKKIYLLRESDGSGAAVTADLNTLVAPGDTINVPESFF